MITRRHILSGSGSVLATSLLRGRAPRARDRKRNLLYLLADDHAAYVMGADGNRLAQTLNVDRLASEGTRFAQNYCNAPLCTASRQSFFSVAPRQSIYTEYLENEEACIRTERWKFIYRSTRRLHKDGYLAADPLPGRYMRVIDERSHPGEFTNIAAKHPELVEKFTHQLLTKFRATHPDAPAEPGQPHEAGALDWYLRPRDAAPSPAWSS